MPQNNISDFLKDIGEFASQKGREAYIVGGYVRDFLLKSPTKDIDIVVNCDAIELIKSYQEAKPGTLEIIEAFEQFKTIKIKLTDSDHDIEFASTRIETYKEPAAFPKVTIINNIKDDLARRDFTINALLQSIMPNNYAEVVDHVNGQKDLEDKAIRVFHDLSFIDDPTRIYRAIRFMAKFNFQIEPHTVELMRAAVQHQDFPKWFKKRKNRFQIELDYIKNLEPEQAKKGLEALKSLDL